MSHEVAFDFETDLIAPDNIIPEPICVSYSDGTKSGLYVTEDMEAFLFEQFQSDNTLIAHNAKFELAIIYKYYPKLRHHLFRKLSQGQIVCTKINERLINNYRKNISFKFSLADLVKFYYKKDISETKGEDAWRMRYSELRDVALENWPVEAVTYAIDDSIWAYKVYKKQDSVNLSAHVEAEFYLTLIATKGIRIDQTRVDRLRYEIETLLKPCYKLLENHGLYDGRKKVKEFRKYVSENIKNVRKTPTGAVALDHESLLLYMGEKEDSVINAYLKIMTYEKVLNSFINNLETANPCIYTEYNGVVSTGRTSSHKSKLFPSVNIQQMPRKVDNVTYDVRNCFVARDGYKLFSIDYSGLELCAVASQLYNYYGRSKLRDTINEGNTSVDLHSKLACKIMSLKEKKFVSYEEFVQHKHEELYGFYRQLSKPINLGFPGGIGFDTMRKLLAKDGIFPRLDILETSPYLHDLLYYYRALSNDSENLRIRQVEKFKYELVDDELVAFKRELYNLYPELESFLSEDHKNFKTGHTKMIKNEFGVPESEDMYKYNTHGFVRDWCTYTAFCNGYLMQTPSAIGAKYMINNIIKKYHDNSKVHVLAFIHDELLFEVLDNSDKHAIVTDIENIMVKSMEAKLPSVRITTESKEMNYWEK